ncbi:MAG: T9SS type A sorting domain-containing protein [Bacteroidales bacterium]|jgi:hypothetical protein|nr:T9SS type A sorting domain-containing protein [Bacteroidales bacterium]
MKRYVLILIISFFYVSLSAQDVDCTNYSQWNSETLYQRNDGGEQIYVVHSEILYRLADAVWSTQGNEPGVSARWDEIVPCGVPFDLCNYAVEWDSYQDYNRQDGGHQLLVTRKGQLCEMAVGEWWSENHPPEKPEYNQYWTQLKQCYAYTEPVCGDFDAWESDVVYSKYDEVFYNGFQYVLKKWWSKNHKPDISSRYWNQTGECPESETPDCELILWDFSENQNQIIYDSSGMYQAELFGGAVQFAEESHALYFDGQGHYLDFESIENDFSQRANQSATVSFWISIEEPEAPQTIFHAWDSHGNKNLKIEFLNHDTHGQQLIFTFLDQSRQVEIDLNNLASPMAAGDKLWHHVLMTWSIDDEIMQIYIDGTPAGNPLDLKNINWEPDFDDVIFGAEAPEAPGNSGQAADYFTGVLDNFRFCSDLMTEEEVSALYNREYGSFSGGTLPIELLYFNPECGQDNGVDIKWSTSSEENNDYFTVYRSLDGKNWEKIAQVEGAGNSRTVENYTFHDVEPTTHDTYYKLAQSDYDGTREDFEIVAIYCKYDHKEITIFPNPATDYIKLTFINEHHVEAPLPVMIYTAQGVLVHKQEFFAAPDYNEWRVNLPDYLKNGNYYMQVKLGADYFYTQPFIIQK